nr:hypothetical protein [Campylobacter sp.]
MENQEFQEFVIQAKKCGLNIIEYKQNDKVLLVGVGENETDVTKGFYWQIHKNDIETDLKTFDVDTQKMWLNEDKHLFKGREYQYELKKEWIEKMDKLKKILEQNKELAVYRNNGAYYTIFKPDTDDKTNLVKETDLMKIKSILKDFKFPNEQEQAVKNLEKKVDEKLIEHICEKHYSGYENCEADQKFFKESKVAYDDNGFIEKIQLIGDSNWIYLRTNFDDMIELDKFFSESEYVKKQQGEKTQTFQIYFTQIDSDTNTLSELGGIGFQSKEQAIIEATDEYKAIGTLLDDLYEKYKGQGDIDYDSKSFKTKYGIFRIENVAIENISSENNEEIKTTGSINKPRKRR